MSMLKRILVAAGLLAALTLSAQPRGPVRGTLVEDPDAHDPVAAFCDGRYYVFTTGLTVMSSADLKSWRFEDRVLPDTPQWAKDKGFRGMPWAPDIQFINGKWYLYYSYSRFGKNTSAIGVATNKTLNPASPDFKWEDQGMIVESIPGRDEWNAIDANVFVDEDGTGWLCFGSCCRGKNSTYNVVVGRADKVMGPYIDKDGVPLMQGGGTLVAKGDERYAGMGHCAVVTFDDQDYMFLHGYDGQADYRSKLLVGKISWTPDGWPVLKL